MNELILELRKYYGPEAEFRDGQEDAIRGILQGRRALVVQKTGWGKSLVYFLATKIMRKGSKGITLIISPLLALMNNQIDSAQKLQLKVRTINSSNSDEWDGVIEELRNDQVDALIISPERLANNDFKRILSEKLATQVQLFVVDEAHCISDWGHDFRPDYRRIIDIIKMLPSNVPVLATTATANNRVINDIKTQLGNDLLISRGSLMRESLAIQVVKLNTREERLAWILNSLKNLSGTGIIYCLTTNDCRLVSKWLNDNGVLCESFYADIDEKEQKDKTTIIQSFMENKIKVLVATVAFGMGFDKPDISFVIHFQKPGNIVAYYQQIGRAGRAIDKAYAILLCGEEDDEINNYFIESAFPTEDLMGDVIRTVVNHPGLKISEFERYINMKYAKIKSCIKYLLVNGDIYEEKRCYYKTPKPWKPDLSKSREVTEIRKNELQQMNDFAQMGSCYMEFIARVLDDPQAKECGQCSNCLKQRLLPIDVPQHLILQAQRFIKEDFNIIEPRKRWPGGIRVDEKTIINKDYLCETGRVLSNYGDAGWGRAIIDGKYKKGYFDEQLVEASYSLLKEYVEENQISWVTNVPSIRRPNLVKDFAQRLAQRLGRPYYESIEKIMDAHCQKELNTSYLQYRNAEQSFKVIRTFGGNVLLVDDMVDSRWTFTVCGYKLRERGCGKVFPFALANSAGRNGDD